MQGYTILLVDDEKDFVQTLAERLILRGMEVELAYDGLGALESLSRRKPDIVILDLHMPGMMGDDVLHSIKSRYADLPVILLTGHCEREDAEHGPLSTAFACLTKPLALPRLLETMRAALQGTHPASGANATPTGDGGASHD